MLLYFSISVPELTSGIGFLKKYDNDDLLHCLLVLPVGTLNNPGKKTSHIPSFTLSGCKEILLTFGSFTSWGKGSSLSGP